jgi:hypothetical protein
MYPIYRAGAGPSRWPDDGNVARFGPIGLRFEECRHPGSRFTKCRTASAGFIPLAVYKKVYKTAVAGSLQKHIDVSGYWGMV